MEAAHNGMHLMNGEAMRKGDWIQTFTGVEFYPLDPRPEDIKLADIAHALSMQCRYSGHVQQFYSVAEHSVRVAELCPSQDQMWGLMHDAAEAYLVDLPRPIKRHSGIGDLYRAAESALMEVICRRFGLPILQPTSVEEADKAMLWVESQALLPPHCCWNKWQKFTTGRERPIHLTMTPDEAEDAFLTVFGRLENAAA